MKLIINNREVELRFSFKSDLIFESIQNHSFKGDTETDWVVYFYSTYLALTEDLDCNLDDFIKFLDEQPENLYAFIAWYTKVMTNQMALLPKGEDDKKKVGKKKSKQKKQ